MKQNVIFIKFIIIYFKKYFIQYILYLKLKLSFKQKENNLYKF